MSNIKVGAASLNQTPLDWERNKKNVIDALYEAKREGGELPLPKGKGFLDRH
jgi:hypothetical protein